MFLTRRFYLLSAVVVMTIAAGWAWAPLFTVGQVLLCLLTAVVAAEIAVLWRAGGMEARRDCRQRFSNGDDNEVAIHLLSHYHLPARLEVIDETPVAFQRRDIDLRLTIAARGEQTARYTLRPVRRGAYAFGRIRVFVAVLAGLVQRRFTLGEAQEIKVYPSYFILRQYELLAFSQKLTEAGQRRLRRPGINTEFEQIKDYVKGDDYRAINWKATARRGALMVNVYSEERSQQVYCVIDKGRMMQQTFHGMTCLDYAINATLVLSYIVIHREDKAGLITFAGEVDTVLPAESRPGQMEAMLQTLYRQQTAFDEPDYSALVAAVAKHLSRRSLLIVFSNFSTLTAMRRQLPYLRQLSKSHRVLVVFFRDDEIERFAHRAPVTEEQYFQQVMAEQAVADKRFIASALRQYGIETLLVKPEALTVDVINKYLSLRRR